MRQTPKHNKYVLLTLVVDVLLSQSTMIY